MNNKRGLIKSYEGVSPKLHETSFIAEGAVVIGNVEIGEESSVWYNAVLRGDVGNIKIGKHSNVQDNSVIHTDEDGETIIGDFVTLGHNVNIHNAEIGDCALIGNGAIVLDYAKIGAGSIIAAGTVIPPKKIIPPNSLVMGNPYKIAKELTVEAIEATKRNSLLYCELAKKHSK